MKKFLGGVMLLGLVACQTTIDGEDGALVSIDESELNTSASFADEYAEDQYIVVLREGADADALAIRHNAVKGLDLGPQNAVVLRGVKLATLQRLALDEDVYEIRPDPIAHMYAPPGGGSTGEVMPNGIDRVGADEISNKGTGVKVCVVDSGVDYNHADLAGNYIGGHDFINNDSDPMDDNGHGTHVAGTIAALDNTIGVIGVAPEAKIIAAKVLNRRGSGSYSAITAGVNYCVAQGAQVINMSLGGPADDPTLKSALEAAKAAGATIVVAAGNDGVNLDTSPHYPAAYNNTVITVSAAWIDSAVAGSSLFGAAVKYPTFSNYGSVVDISAPGTYVLSTKKGGGTTSMSGTSMACPHVAGAAALYLATNPGASPAQVEAALEAAAENVNNVSTHPEEMLNVRSF